LAFLAEHEVPIEHLTLLDYDFHGYGLHQLESLTGLKYLAMVNF
jgi:hypothetical protein